MGGGLVVFIGLVWLVMILGDDWDDDVDTMSPAAETQNPAPSTIELSAGFWPDPHRVLISAGGSQANASYFTDGPWPECAFGYTEEAHSAMLSYRGPADAYLNIAAVGDGDLTLHILLPNGSWVCDDDSFGNLDPLVAIPWAQSGEYLIWLGTISGEQVPAELLVSEMNLVEYRDRTPEL